MQYAGVIIRGIAFLLDIIFLSIFFFPITYLVKGTWIMVRKDHVWWGGFWDPLCLIFLIIIFLYFIISEGLTGHTIGKLLTGLKVIKENGSKITIKQSIIRTFGRIIDGLPFLNLAGIISIFISPQKQRLGDKFAKTVVIKR